MLSGDLGFAEECARSACVLLAGEPELVRAQAERQFAEVQRVLRAVAAYPERSILRPHYGPFVTSRGAAGLDPAAGEAST